jgi:hypothetical protein
MLLDSQAEIIFKISKKTGKYERHYHFDNGIYLHCISTRPGLYRIGLNEPGLVEALLDMARCDGTKGQIMMYGFAGYFGSTSE